MLGSSSGSVELIRRAKAQGIYTIVTDNLQPEQSVAKLESDEYWMISTADVDQMEEKCRLEGVTAAICGISEFNTARLAELCQRLDLPCWCTPESWNISANKHNFKKACMVHGVPVATDYHLSNPPTEEELDKLVFPVVVKAVDLGANRGMSYCHTKEEAVAACAYARSLSRSEQVITERMLNGMEYEAHYILADGEASLYCFAAMLPQPGYPGNCYGVTTTATNHLQRFLREVEPGFKKLMKESGCRDGIAWMEMILDEDGHFYVLEMGHRMSGDLIELALQDATGFDSFQWLLEIAMGKKHTKEDLPASLVRLPEEHVFSYILWSKTAGTLTKVEGVEEIAAVDGARIVMAKHAGESFDPYRYMLTVVFHADSQEKMIDLVKKVNSTVVMEDENHENILLYYDDFDTMRRIFEEGRNELQ